MRFSKLLFLATLLVTQTAIAGLNQIPGPVYGNQVGTAPESWYVGSIVSNSTTGTAITTGSTVNATSISLTPGVYFCWARVQFVPATGTVIADIAAGISTTSVTLPPFPYSSYLGVSLTAGANGDTAIDAFNPQELITTTTTLYAIAEATSVTISTASVNGYIACLRTA
jgi:hypothetical protein